jgi:phosphonate degradation associated HDIG domain protein
MENEQANLIADEIITLYQQHGGEEYAGERVSQLEHMVQSAQIAAHNGFDDDVVLAAFLHDIGHICVSAFPSNSMDGFGIVDHEKIGAEYLRKKGFSQKVAKLVESHVAAKRYLTFKDPEYFEGLSDASKKTLEYQGGRMSAAEADIFERDPLFELIVAMRKIDEQAKVQDLPLPQWTDYKNLIVQHLSKN